LEARGYLSGLASAGVTQLVECNLAKVDVASSSLVTRSSLDGATRAARKLFERLERSSNALRASASPMRSHLGMVRLWRTISSPAPIIVY
jgi:hypothetical protein